VLDVVRRKPGLDGGERMPVLLGMAVLIAEPRLVPRWLLPALPEHRIEGHEPEAARAGHRPSYAKGQAGDGVVDPDHDHAAPPREPGEGGERRARVRRMMQDARAVHDVEHAGLQSRLAHIGLDEPRALDAEA